MNMARLKLFIVASVLVSMLVAVAYVYLFCVPDERASGHIHSDKVDYGAHTVLLVVVDTWGNPRPDLLIECVQGDERKHGVTDAEGRCYFILIGRVKYVVSVYNETMGLQKEVDLCPVHTHYTFVIDGAN